VAGEDRRVRRFEAPARGRCPRRWPAGGDGATAAPLDRPNGEGLVVLLRGRAGIGKVAYRGKLTSPGEGVSRIVAFAIWLPPSYNSRSTRSLPARTGWRVSSRAASTRHSSTDGGLLKPTLRNVPPGIWR